jgi:pimeloyl-ACP methyl ester carboxylesterase
MSESRAKTVLLLHAGVADRRMWEPQLAPLEGAGWRVLAPDLRGFGDLPFGTEPFSNVGDVAPLLDGPVAVVGNSLGGRVALELVLEHPGLVERLVLIAPGMPDWDWSELVRGGWAAEEAAFERGDLDGAAEASLRLWIDGPNRPPEAVDAGVRDAVRTMILRSYELEHEAPDERGEELPGPAVKERLREIRCPTLVLVGEEDVPDMQAIAAHVAGSIDGARLVTVAGAAHLPSLERPDEVNAELLGFLAGS